MRSKVNFRSIFWVSQQHRVQNNTEIDRMKARSRRPSRPTYTRGSKKIHPSKSQARNERKTRHRERENFETRISHSRYSRIHHDVVDCNGYVYIRALTSRVFDSCFSLMLLRRKEIARITTNTQISTHTETTLKQH